MIQPKSELICCEHLIPTYFDEQISNEFPFGPLNERIHTFELINFENKYEDEKSFVNNDSEKQQSLLTSNNKNRNDDNFWNIEEYIQDDSDIKIIELSKLNTNKEHYCDNNYNNYLNSYEKNKGISYTYFDNTEKIISLDEGLVNNMKNNEDNDNFDELNEIYNISSYSNTSGTKNTL